MQPPTVFGGGGQDGGYVNTQTVLPNNAIHFPPGTHSQPSTPTIGMCVRRESSNISGVKYYC
jgi:hypothetical protein